jgi:hypothetical protein
MVRGSVLIARLDADGARLPGRSVLSVAAALSAALAVLLGPLPQVAGTVAPVLALPVIVVVTVAGLIDARAGAIATVVAVLGSLVGVPAVGPMLVASLAGQAIVLGLLSVLAPLLVRSIGLILPVPTEPSARTPVDGPSVRAAAAGVFAALLVLLWPVGASVFAASVIPGAGFFDTQPSQGIRWLVPVALVVGALRQIVAPEVPPVRSRPASSRVRALLAAVPGTVLIPLLVLSLYRDAPLGLAGVVVLVVLIRLVRLGLLPSPLEFLLRQVLEVEQRIRGAHLFGLALVVSLIIGQVVGDDLARIRSGYLLLLCVLLLLSRSDARSTVGSVRLAPPALRASAATVALTLVLSGIVLAFAAPGGRPAVAQTAESPQLSVPDLVGTTALLSYRYSALGSSGAYDRIETWSASLSVVSARPVRSTDDILRIELELEGTIGFVRERSAVCGPDELGFPLMLVDATVSVEEVIARLRGTADGGFDALGDLILGSGAYRTPRVLTRPPTELEAARRGAPGSPGCAEPVIITGAVLDGGEGVMGYSEDLVGRPVRLVPTEVYCFSANPDPGCSPGRIDELVHDLPVFVLPPLPPEPTESPGTAGSAAVPVGTIATDTGTVTGPIVPRSAPWPLVPPLLAIVLPAAIATSGVLAGGTGLGATAATPRPQPPQPLQQAAADVRWTVAQGVGRPTIGLPDADLEELLEDEERRSDPS